MSFGEAASVPIERDESEATLRARSTVNTLRSLIRVLAVNSATLRRWDSPSEPEAATAELTRVRALRSETRQTVVKSSEAQAQLESYAASEDADPAIQDELVELRIALKQGVNDFTDALRESIAHERDIISSAAQTTTNTSTLATQPELGESRTTSRPYTASYATENTALLAADEREQALVRELEGTAELRRQRANALRDIQSSVQDVNAIMTDLASMIGDQGSTLEFVAVNVEDAAQYSNRAGEQLERARRARQRKQKMFFALLAVVAVVFAVTIVILLS